MRIPRKLALTVLAGVAVAGLAGASAASLGTSTGTSVGATDVSVGACDNDGVNLTYVTTFRNNRYEVSQVNVNGVAIGCDGMDASLTLRDSGGNPITSTGPTAIALNGGSSFSVPVTGVTAQALYGVSLLIQG